MVHVRSDLRGGMRPRNAITLLGGASAICPAAVQAAEDIRKLAEQAISRLGLQTTLPTVLEPTSPPFRLQLPPEAMWLVIIIAIAVLLYAFRDMIPIFGSKRDGTWKQDEEFFGDTKLRASAETLSVADELAAHGR